MICYSALHVLKLVSLSLGWLWPPFASLEMLVGPFGATWAPKDFSLGSLWHFFGSLGMPVGPFWAPWAPKESLE